MKKNILFLSLGLLFAGNNIVSSDENIIAQTIETETASAIKAKEAEANLIKHIVVFQKKTTEEAVSKAKQNQIEILRMLTGMHNISAGIIAYLLYTKNINLNQAVFLYTYINLQLYFIA